MTVSVFVCVRVGAGVGVSVGVGVRVSDRNCKDVSVSAQVSTGLILKEEA